MAFATAADIDGFLAERKTIFGQPEWVTDERRARVFLRASLQLQDGRIPGSVFVELVATRYTDPQRGSMVLVCNGRPVQRMSYRPDHLHRQSLQQESIEGPAGPDASCGAYADPSLAAEQGLATTAW